MSERHLQLLQEMLDLLDRYARTVTVAALAADRETWLKVKAALEVAAESATSLALIWLGREPEGTARAEWHDWPSMAVWTLVTREATVCAWAVVLAAVVWIVRRTVLREGVEEDQTGT